MNADRVLDTRPLRASPAFRRLWAGTTASTIGSQVAVVAVALQVWDLTRNPLWSGAIGFVSGAAMLVFGIVGGTLADALDRRTLVLVTSAGAMVASALLAVQAVLGAGSPVLVIALVGMQTTCVALGAGARRTFVSRLLPRDQVPAGVALNHIGFQVAMIGGQAVGGVVVAAGGFGWAYAVDAASTLLALYGVARLPRMRVEGATPAGLRSLVGGAAFAIGRPVLRGLLVTDAAQTVLAMPVALFPLVNAERFGGDPVTYGFLLSAVGVGGLLAGLTSGAVTRAARPGAVSLVAAGVWGLALAGFGLAGSLPSGPPFTLPLTLAALAVAGAADVVSVISRGSIVQLATPDAYRGRVTSLEIAVGAGGPGLGDARAGLVAGLTSGTVAAVSGGLACVAVVAAQAVLNPALRRWRY